jgi:hypothetical protein
MKRTLIVGGVLVTVIAVSSVWRLTTGNDPQPTNTAATSTIKANNSPTVEAQGKRASEASNLPEPTAVEPPADQSPDTAIAAAVRFLELDEALFPGASPAHARKLSNSITSASARDRLGRRAEQHQEEILAKGDLEGLVLRLAPISARVRNHTTTSTTVDIYFLRLWSFPKTGALDDYATAQLDLVWEANQWRLTDSSVIDGPYPVARFSARAVMTSTAKRFEDALAGYSDKGLHR